MVCYIEYIFLCPLNQVLCLALFQGLHIDECVVNQFNVTLELKYGAT
jgi:hypothetical protein